jgi:hypothetical protein
VVQPSGNRTVRVSLAEATDVEPGATLLAGIKRLGCTYEGAFKKVICIDIPPSVPLDSVAKFLTELSVE